MRVYCRPGVMPEVDFLWRRERLILETVALMVRAALDA
jgi:hypothetical protein